MIVQVQAKALCDHDETMNQMTYDAMPQQAAAAAASNTGSSSISASRLTGGRQHACCHFQGDGQGEYGQPQQPFPLILTQHLQEPLGQCPCLFCCTAVLHAAQEKAAAHLLLQTCRKNVGGNSSIEIFKVQMCGIWP